MSNLTISAPTRTPSDSEVRAVAYLALAGDLPDAATVTVPAPQTRVLIESPFAAPRPAASG